MKTILLPTDFSANAFNAGRYAIDLFRDERVNFVLMHAYKVNDFHENSVLIAKPGLSTLEKEKKLIDDKFKAVLKDLKEYSEKAHFFHTADHNLLLTDAIGKELRKNRIDFVVIGNQGHTAGNKAIYGSNTINIMEEIQKCPILSVPSNITFYPPIEIVLANSFKAELEPADLNFLIFLAQKFNAAIRILHISEEGGLNREQHHNRKLLKEKLEGVKHSFHSLEYLSVPLGIYSFIESRESGMIAFINKKHSFIENLLMNPLYKNLAHYSKIPVLVLHQPPEPA
jgi:nucleotide-binding universal stress UspA family protein